jgi:hypothetical protein
MQDYAKIFFMSRQSSQELIENYNYSTPAAQQILQFAREPSKLWAKTKKFSENTYVYVCLYVSVGNMMWGRVYKFVCWMYRRHTS